MQKIKNWIINISVLIITCIIFLILFEVYLRFFDPQLTLDRAEQFSSKYFEKSDYTPWKLKPNADVPFISSRGEFSTRVKINSMGLREKEFDVNNPNNTFRFIVLGDSMTFAYGVEANESYTKVLENELNKNSNGINYEGLNLGRADGGNEQAVQYLYLKEKGIKFHPDLVIVGMFVGNDLTDISDKNEWYKTDKNGLPTNITSDYYYVDENNRLRRTFENKSYYDKYNIFGKVNYYISKKSHTFIFFKQILIANASSPSKVFFKDEPQDIKEDFKKFKLVTKEMQKISKIHNSSYVIVLLPDKIQVNDQLWAEYRNYYKDINTSRTMPQDIIMKYCNQEKISCINLLPYFLNASDRDSYFFKIDGHMNKRGHEQTGMFLFKELKKDGLIWTIKE